MFDNFGTALVQALGFFSVFAFFVYQLLSDGKKTIKTQLKSSKKKLNESKNINDKLKRKGLFGRKTEPIIEEVKPKKKGLFSRQSASIENLGNKKKGWFK